MQIHLLMSFDDVEIVRLLNLVARIDGRIMRGRPDLPLLYRAGVIYRPEAVETFRDVLHMYAAGEEDCDSLAAARAGEVLARGAAAIEPGDPGYEASRAQPLRSYRAEVFLTTRTRPGEPGMHHAVTRYLIGRTWFTDDPSARLGMLGNKIDPVVATRWRSAGLLDGVVRRWAGLGHELRFPSVRRFA